MSCDRLGCGGDACIRAAEERLAEEGDADLVGAGGWWREEDEMRAVLVVVDTCCVKQASKDVRAKRVSERKIKRVRVQHLQATHLSP